MRPQRIYTSAPNQYGLPVCSALRNDILFPDWIPGDPAASIAARDDLHSNLRLSDAIEEAASHNPEIIYFDDSQALSEVEILELARRVRSRWGGKLAYYGQPTGADPFSRNAIQNNRWNARVWEAAGRWSTATYRGRNFAKSFEFDCPSIYLQPGTESQTGLDVASAWRFASLETLLAAERTSPLPTLAFAAILDKEANANEKIVQYVAATLKRWGIDICVWGKNQEPVLEALMERG